MCNLAIFSSEFLFSNNSHGNRHGLVGSVLVHRYRAILNEFLFTKIEEEDIANICHTAEATLDVLHPVFEDSIISRRADVVWPSRNCDLNYYLRGAVKDKC